VRSLPGCCLPDGAAKGSACSASSRACPPWSPCRPGSGWPGTTWPPRRRPWPPRRACCHWLPGGREARQATRAERTPGTRGGRLAGTLRLPLIFAAATIAAGVLDSFLPLAHGIPSNLCSAALLVQAIAATFTRWQAGRLGDRHGHARPLISALVVAAAGMATMMLLGSAVALFAGMVLFGAGFGVIENATFALLIGRLPEAKASALWNFAYDAGYGAGPAVFGLICVHTGYPAAFALCGVLILAAVPAAARERQTFRARRPG
jgi:MFS family permease